MDRNLTHTIQDFKFPRIETKRNCWNQHTNNFSLSIFSCIFLALKSNVVMGFVEQNGQNGG